MSSLALKTAALAAQRRLDPDAAQWRSTVRVAGASVSDTQAKRVSQLVKALKTSGVWSALDRLWLFAAENPTQALLDVKARATATAVNSPAFTGGRGYKGSHLSAYINSNFNPTTASGPNYTRNSCCYGCWVETPESAPSVGYRIMGNDETNYGEFAVGASTYSITIQSPAGFGTTIPSTSIGSITATRPGANNFRAFLNGIFDSNANAASTVVPNSNFYILAANNNGTPYQQSDTRLAAAWIGGGLTDSQVAALHAALRQYMTAQGVT